MVTPYCYLEIRYFLPNVNIVTCPTHCECNAFIVPYNIRKTTHCLVYELTIRSISQYCATDSTSYDLSFMCTMGGYIHTHLTCEMTGRGIAPRTSAHRHSQRCVLWATPLQATRTVDTYQVQFSDD